MIHYDVKDHNVAVMVNWQSYIKVNKNMCMSQKKD